MSSSPNTRTDKVVSVRLTEPEHKLLRVVSASQGLSMAGYVEEALKARLQREAIEMSSEFARLARLSDELGVGQETTRRGLADA
jgi:predicted DNA-binding protein